MQYNKGSPSDAPGDCHYDYARSEDSIGAPQANDGTEPEPRSEEVCDGKQGPEEPISQQQAQAVGEGKEGAQGEKGRCEATRPLVQCDAEDSSVRMRGWRLGTSDSWQSDGRGWADSSGRSCS